MSRRIPNRDFPREWQPTFLFDTRLAMAVQRLGITPSELLERIVAAFLLGQGDDGEWDLDAVQSDGGRDWSEVSGYGGGGDAANRAGRRLGSGLSV